MAIVTHVVMFSGGVGSWAAATRTIAAHGRANVVLLFADTLIEDADTYRFLPEAAAALGVPLVRVADGRNPWQVFRDEGYLGNSRIAPCSRVLKQVVCRRWMATNAPAGIVVLGLDWTEAHRVDGAVNGWKPFTVECPLIERPFKAKSELLSDMEKSGIRMPALYRLGYLHNNCGGGCPRAGIGQWRHHLRANRDNYLLWEGHEEEFRADSGKDVSMLKDRRHGNVAPLTLRSLRERLDAEPEMFSNEDWGGCGCFVDEGPL